MVIKINTILLVGVALFSLAGCSSKTFSSKQKTKAGIPFGDEKHQAAAQTVPGVVYCAYYDLGGEGVAYHDKDKKNNGSGSLNPVNGSYLHSFRIDESVDVSYTKEQWDMSQYNRTQMPLNLLYVGWTEPGEWIKYTIDVKQSGAYTVSLLYTSNQGGKISVTPDNSAQPVFIDIPSTFDALDPEPIRQWHHWNEVTGKKPIVLSQGVQTITLRTEETGQMNYATLTFRLVE